MFVHNIDPVFLSLGPFSIRYYGLAYALGAIAGYLFLLHHAKKGTSPMNEEETADYMTYILLGMLIGARLFYMVFYNAGFYLENPSQILAFWKGGMSFHGGLLGVFLGGYLFSKRYKKNWLQLADLTVFPFTCILGIGRIANFINAELFGSITSLPWGVNFLGETTANGDLVYRHPSQLYEAAKNFLAFAIMWPLHAKLRDGSLLFGFMIYYAVIRFLIEFIRLPDPQLGYLFGSITMGQLLNLPLLGLGIFGLWYAYKK